MSLASYMRLRGLDDAALAEIVGVSTSAVRKWKYGERKPRGERLRRLIAVTDGAVRVRDFFEDLNPL